MLHFLIAPSGTNSASRGDAAPKEIEGVSLATWSFSENRGAKSSENTPEAAPAVVQAPRDPSDSVR